MKKAAAVWIFLYAQLFSYVFFVMYLQGKLGREKRLKRTNGFLCCRHIRPEYVLDVETAYHRDLADSSSKTAIMI